MQQLVEVDLSFFDLLNLPDPPLPAERFQSDHLRKLFSDKIARSRATGKDGIRVSSFEEDIDAQIAIIERKIASGSYQFTSYKERLILKGAGKPPRQICIPTVRDRLVLRAICQILHTSVPKSVDFSPHTVVDSVAKKLRSKTTARSFIRIDVKEFFPSIRHELLDAELGRFGIDPLTRSLVMRAVGTRIGDAETVSKQGVPQGLSISGALACLYMLRFDERQQKKFIDYFRYVDDILIISDSEAAENALDSAKRALSRLGLTIHPSGTSGKTETTCTEDGIDYLGYHISRNKISVRKSSYRRMFKNVSKVTTDFRYRKDAERLVFRLNLKITGCIIDGKRRGWMMFFSRTEDMHQLAHLDKFVTKQLKFVECAPENFPRIKKFVKSYYEINYKIDKTSYIPNFDTYSIEQKTEVVSILSGRPVEEVQAFDVEMLERQFGRLLGKEIRDLEQDVGNPS